MSRFEGLVTASMEDLFRGEATIDGVSYEAACSGGRVFRDFDEMGLPVHRRMRTLRIRKELLAPAPSIGDALTWTPEDGAAVSLRVAEVPSRPHEAAWAIICREA